MRAPPAPIRFLLLAVGGWVAIRAVTLLPTQMMFEDAAFVKEASALSPGALPARAAAGLPAAASLSSPDAANAAMSGPAGSRPDLASSGHLTPVRQTPWRVDRELPAGGAAVSTLPMPNPSALWALSRSPGNSAIASLLPAPLPGGPVALGARPPAGFSSRLSGSVWLFARDRGDPGLAPGGTLGGSQAGARLAYRLHGDARRPVSLSGRLYAPLDRPAGAEAAIGIDWRPIAGLALNLLAERRQRLGRDGRSDFALTIYGGTETRLLRGRVRVEAYGQAGVVGVEERDLFADGAVVATTRIGPVEVGGGAWGGAQPGVARLDLGPHASVQLPLGGIVIRAVAEWRFRIAGDAGPASGPALTLSAGF